MSTSQPNGLANQPFQEKRLQIQSDFGKYQQELAETEETGSITWRRGEVMSQQIFWKAWSRLRVRSEIREDHSSKCELPKVIVTFELWYSEANLRNGCNWLIKLRKTIWMSLWNSWSFPSSSPHVSVPGEMQRLRCWDPQVPGMNWSQLFSNRAKHRLMFGIPWHVGTRWAVPIFLQDSNPHLEAWWADSSVVGTEPISPGHLATRWAPTENPRLKVWKHLETV